ncbi:MAG: ribonuclease P protein component [Eubacteriales bacterium]|nr:ribonuclease P protein component [Eubacteriales bacterium]
MLMTQTLRKNFEFGRVYQRGQHVASKTLVLHYFPRKQKIVRLGVTASKQVKGSVARNRAKRLLREAYRLNEDKLRPGFDLILVGRAADGPVGLRQVETDFLKLCRRAGLLKQVQPPIQSPSITALPEQQS